jgi:hypothetical protein
VTSLNFIQAFTIYTVTLTTSLVLSYIFYIVFDTTSIYLGKWVELTLLKPKNGDISKSKGQKATEALGVAGTNSGASGHQKRK